MTTTADTSVRHDSKSHSFHHHHHKSPHLPDQLVRIRIIDGQFDSLKPSADTYAVISIGGQAARTKVVKNSNRPVFEENFAVGYELSDEKSEIVIDLFEKGDLVDERMGEFRLTLAQVDPPYNRKSKNKEQRDTIPANKDTILPDPLSDKNKDIPPQNAETWANAQPHKALLVNRKGDKVGFLNILVRRELRLHGTLNIHVTEIDLSPNSDQSFWSQPTTIVAKLGQERFESPVISPDAGMTRVPFTFDVRFAVNDNNNISDVFFELWQQGQAIAEARLPLYDTRKRYRGSLMFIAPFGGHDVTDTNQKYPVAQLFLNSQFENQVLA